MNRRTLEFVSRRFRSYYARAHIPEPPRAREREWAFVRFESLPAFVMRRHMGFSTFDDVLLFLRNEAPMHAYYSTALYANPSAQTMQKKGWRGAELIFDLDADHLRDAPESYSAMLELVKKETLKLVEFVVDDFGFEDVHVVFSGGRGYHVHVRDETVLSLGSSERREIVDYVRATGIELEYVMHRWSQRKVGHGWSARLARCVGRHIAQYAAMEPRKALKALQELPEVGKKRAEMLLALAHRIAGGEPPEGWVGELASRDTKKLTAPLLGKCLRTLLCEVDEPVSTDIKRLIRLEGSLHGKTGLKVVPIGGADELRAFEPLSDAIVFSDAPVRVNVLKPSTVEFRGECEHLEQGECELPEYAAIYLMCRGVAELA